MKVHVNAVVANLTLLTSKANYGLLKTCEADYKMYKEEYNCPDGKTAHGSLANVLLCLENALNDGEFLLVSVKLGFSMAIFFSMYKTTILIELSMMLC